MQRLKELQAKYGARAKAMIVFEWRNYKRLLQHVPRYRWKNIKSMTRVQFADRVYRQDERAEDDFSMLCRREAPQHQAKTESVDGVGQLRDEYLNATMKPGKHYSLHTEKSCVDAQGNPIR